MGIKRRKFLVDRFPDAIRAKWPMEILDEGFTPFPKRLLRCLDEVLGRSDAVDDLRVVLALADYQRPDETPPARTEMLAAIAGMTAERFSERLSELQRRDLVRFGCRGDIIYEV